MKTVAARLNFVIHDLMAFFWRLSRARYIGNARNITFGYFYPSCGCNATNGDKYNWKIPQFFAVAITTSVFWCSNCTTPASDLDACHDLALDGENQIKAAESVVGGTFDDLPDLTLAIKEVDEAAQFIGEIEQ